MSRLIRFFTKILDICKLVPMLPVVVIAAIPLALLGDWRPWGNAMAIPVLGNPGFGQWLVIALVLVIVIDTVVLCGEAALWFCQGSGNRGLRRRPCFPFFLISAGDRIRREVLPVLHQ